MEKTVSALSRAFWDSQMVSVRLLLALSELTWAALLLWPGPTFGRPTYNGMAAIMPENCWALVFLLTAMAQMTVVVSENFHSLPARIFAAYNAILWTTVVVSMMVSVYPPPAAISAEIAMAFASTWIWLRPIILYNWMISAKRVAHESRL